MFRFVAIAGAMLSCGALVSAEPAFDRDYLSSDDRQWPKRYDTAVRQILSRAWRDDVVLRTIAFHPFDRETVVGVVRTEGGYNAFVMRPSDQIYNGLAAGSTMISSNAKLPRVRVSMRERPVQQDLVTRVQALWRRVLQDPRNYGVRKEPEINKDGSRTIILDMTHFSYAVRTSLRTELRASMGGWGPRTDELIQVTEALQSYVERKSGETALVRAVARAERRLRI